MRYLAIHPLSPTYISQPLVRVNDCYFKPHSIWLSSSCWQIYVTSDPWDDCIHINTHSAAAVFMTLRFYLRSQSFLQLISLTCIGRMNLDLKSHFLVWVCVLVVQSGLTFCDSMGYSLPGFSVHGIFQARILKRVAIPFSRGSSQPRDQTQISCIAGRFFTVWAAREAQSFLFSLNIRTACYIIINMSTCYMLSNIL